MRNFRSTALFVATCCASASAQQPLSGLYGVARTPGSDTLLRIDPLTGAVATIGSGALRADAVAISPQGQIFAGDDFTGQLVILDPATGGVAQVVGPYGQPGMGTMEAMAFHPITGELFALGASTNSLYRVNTTTGQATLLGPLNNGSNNAGLSWSADGATLFAVNYLTGGLYTIDPLTGQATVVGIGPQANAGGPLGLAADPASGALYVSEWWGPTGPGRLSVVDPLTGARTPIGPMTGFAQVEGLSFAPGTPTTVYCTAKQNSLGCTPAIGSTGVSSATATSGFTLDVGGVRNQKPGLFFYRVNGAQAGLTFQCGTLCVGPSNIRRTPVRSAGGNPPPANDCSGVYSIDMNAFAQGLAGGNPDPALRTVGSTVHCQAWGRDQGFPAPCNTTLSDGLEYVVGA